jgi:hypothetical protein
VVTPTPGVTPSIAAGQVESLNVTVTDADGVALQNIPVTVNVTGVNAQSRQLTTDGTGQTIFAYPGNSLLTGSDQIQATATVNSTAAYSNIVAVSCNNGTNQAPVVSAGAPQTITLPSPAILSGTVSDDGLPKNTLSIVWSMQSGPGTVLFDNPGSRKAALRREATGITGRPRGIFCRWRKHRGAQPPTSYDSIFPGCGREPLIVDSRPSRDCDSLGAYIVHPVRPSRAS